MLWNPEIETLERGALRRLQLERLQATLRRVYARVPFYRELFDAAGTPPDSVRSLEDLARPGLRLVATAPQVPIGAYTRQMLQRLSQDPAYGPDFADRVLANVRSEELDVRAVLAKIVLGEGDGGIVYATDITPQVAPEVHTIAIPEAFNVVATYPIALVQGARQPALGERFIALVLSDAGQAVLARYNFQPVR